MSDTIVRALSASTTIFSVPFKRFGILPIGGRSTAIKLASGDVWILVSSPLGDDVKTAIANLGGPVKYLITPDIVHTLHISTYHQAYPEALCIGPEGVKAKVSSVKWAGEYKTNGLASAAERFGFEDEIESCYFAPHPNKDIAFLHKPTKTLIQADLLFNLPANEQHHNGLGMLGSLSSHMAPGCGFHKKMIGAFAKANVAEFTASSKLVAAWDFDRMIPCHGDVMETGAKKAWTDTYADILSKA